MHVWTQPCYDQIDCILGHTVESLKANMASTSIVLGLMPTVLAMFGPSVDEISLLSIYRRLLSLLLSMGAPVVHVARVGQYQDPVAHLLKRMIRKLCGSDGNMEGGRVF